LASEACDAAADIDLEREALPGISLRCLAYAVPLSLLCWAFILFGVALTAGYLKL
jgi:hypothetical protein